MDKIGGVWVGVWVWVWVWEGLGCLQGEGQSEVALCEAWLELDASLGVLTRLG